MTKAKYIIMILLVAIVLFIVPTIVNATDTFTTDDGIVVKKVVTGFSNGSIELNISNIELSSEGNYEWSISTGTSVESITKWYVLGDVNPSKKNAKLNLTVQDNNILAVLRKTSTAYLFIKDSSANTMIINGLELDLTLPPLYAFDYRSWYDNSLQITGGTGIMSNVPGMVDATYNIKNVYYKFEKITDETLVENYKQALLDGTSLSNVFSIDASRVESIDDWSNCTSNNSGRSFTEIEESKIPTDQGAYYLWLKAKDTDSKTVYGCLIVNIDVNSPKVERIYVSSPESGTYKTGQTVKIRVGFSEAIKGSTVPTLKIKFGDSAVRSISTGTIVNTGNENQGSYWSHYIEYSYDIQESDKGQLATVELTGGNIKDSSDNDAVLSFPVITGNTIKANVEGTNNNNTENQDKENNNNNKPSNNNDSTNKKDDTTAIGKLPQTGVSYVLILTIVILLGGLVFAYFKYRNLRGI